MTGHSCRSASHRIHGGGLQCRQRAPAQPRRASRLNAGRCTRIIDINDRRLPGPVHTTVVGVAEPDFSGVTASMRSDVWVSLGAIATAM
jgi:hypothetical protein